ncbi:S8 family serine peptidase [Arcicella sp. LKC2W]|uniref:S8 family serine peptidase n=1 Tax=Arcicella sp. LKC2W TaxID=2984198 RepID=UPI002B1F658E|nr:S8 family serine peptidase [Arcicella sp. LKC2W]MEA5458201.1 S8 family serine peptidase [Arcicella sp. LKC2W]
MCLLFMMFYWGNTQIKAQTISKLYIDGEVYLKVKATQAKTGTIGTQVVPTLSVNIAAELPFLAKMSNKYPVSKALHSFYYSKNTTLNTVYRISLQNPALIKDFLADVVKDASVEYAEPVPLMTAIHTPNDPSFSTSQWHLNTVKADLAWDIFQGNSSQKIKLAVVDDAVQINHPDLAANCIQGWDVADNDNDPSPPSTDYSHGTHVAGIAGAVTNNGIGIASLAYNGVQILPVKSTNSGGGSITHAYEGLAWAANNGAKIISMSWGGGGASVTAQNLINDAYNRGILLVAAAGNSASNGRNYPAAYDNVLSVASTTRGDIASSFTSFGTWVDIAAPGSEIYSSVPFGGYATYSGTSMATPLVSSLAAYIWSKVPSYTPAQVEALIKASADNIDGLNPNYSGQLGAGRINAQRAIQMACPDNPGDIPLNVSGNVTLCNGSSYTLSVRRIANVTYTWYKNDIAQTATDTFLTVNSSGIYYVKATRSTCQSSSNTVNFQFYDTPSPALVSTSDTTTCLGKRIPQGKGVKAVPNNCGLRNTPTTFTYGGGSVGYDGGNSSGANPSVYVSGISANTGGLKVSITWRKQDGGGAYDCATPASGCSYNSETQFSLRSPSGREIVLVNGGTYQGCLDPGVVTTVFEDSGLIIPVGATQSSGTFSPSTPLSTLANELSEGTWTLVPTDLAGADPLCVSGFSLTFTDIKETISWWSAPTGGSLLGRGNILTPTDTLVGNYTYYAEGLCPNSCPSPRLAANFSITTGTIPLNYAFDINLGNSISTLNEQFNTQSITIGGAHPITPPISVCNNTNLVLAATNCGTKLTKWTTGETGVVIYKTFNNTTTNTIQSYCLETATGCQTALSSPITVFVEPTNLTVNNEILENRKATYRATQTVEGTSLLKNTAEIDFKAGGKVDLTPGFNTERGANFNAATGNCPNNNTSIITNK